jgi:hypothetical protein
MDNLAFAGKHFSLSLVILLLEGAGVIEPD